ncbi:hypothetical protein NP233_g7990 [Leucocoprinus birnbaumii]|uniref:Uncharacterized protein n=1 Tax=Leucocoprinus birnbaumii TaxID=56174 RepID=A0AAD5YS99_9AGAR|nr:hypothetical protein NP233_g7990 [Leucocoprinus birnbaumii]
MEVTKLPPTAGLMSKVFVVREIVHTFIQRIFNPISSIRPVQRGFCAIEGIHVRSSTGMPYHQARNRSHPLLLNLLSPPPPAPVFYPPPPPPPPAAYTPPAIPVPNPVEVNGTTYFPLAQEASQTEDFQPLQNGPIVSIPMPIPGALYPPTEFLSDVESPPLLPALGAQYIEPQDYQPRVEPSFLEHAYVNDPSPLLSPPASHAQSVKALPPGDTRLKESELAPASRAESEPVTHEPPLSESRNEGKAESTSSRNSIVEPETTGDYRHKKKSHGHVRRISINVKTGEVTERTLEGRHGVYGL